MSTPSTPQPTAQTVPNYTEEELKKTYLEPAQEKLHALREKTMPSQRGRSKFVDIMIVSTTRGLLFEGSTMKTSGGRVVAYLKQHLEKTGDYDITFYVVQDDQDGPLERILRSESFNCEPWRRSLAASIKQPGEEDTFIAFPDAGLDMIVAKIVCIALSKQIVFSTTPADDDVSLPVPAVMQYSKSVATTGSLSSRIFGGASSYFISSVQSTINGQVVGMLKRMGAAEAEIVTLQRRMLVAEQQRADDHAVLHRHSDEIKTLGQRVDKGSAERVTMFNKINDLRGQVTNLYALRKTDRREVAAVATKVKEMQAKVKQLGKRLGQAIGKQKMMAKEQAKILESIAAQEALLLSMAADLAATQSRIQIQEQAREEMHQSLEESTAALSSLRSFAEGVDTTTKDKFAHMLTTLTEKGRMITGHQLQLDSILGRLDQQAQQATEREKQLRADVIKCLKLLRTSTRNEFLEKIQLVRASCMELIKDESTRATMESTRATMESTRATMESTRATMHSSELFQSIELLLMAEAAARRGEKVICEGEIAGLKEQVTALNAETVKQSSTLAEQNVSLITVSTGLAASVDELSTIYDENKEIENLQTTVDEISADTDAMATRMTSPETTGGDGDAGCGNY